MNQAILDTNCDAVVNLSQWNALGGWTCEIPSYVSTVGSGIYPPIFATTGGKLAQQWWGGEGGVLGINDYISSNPDFEIAGEFMAN